ncbi:ESS family glutamate:Na+ symporter [Bacillus pakistanensis]|uniref:ESS family glutamate:Na+ symporter n=1 Tax=Rossellomorea pakistanensis TaxID=992288 RepID=A0ABS2NHB5_9BACI|nr:sodium:glutamate symporter [Bacillus pakistanensis]MBM7587232.1 ESS family glutamate:Na+ symporter [Bacillus pakistanensis]
MNEFSIWSLMIDISVISGLLLVGTILRAKVKWVQALFLPASMIAGFIGLALGPSGVDILPFSDQLTAYPGLLIAVIFASIPIGAAKVNIKEIIHRVREMWSYSMLLTVLMWGGGALFGLVVINQLFTDLPSGFGLILGAGFLGGHGTAAAIGQGFSQYGWEEAMTLGMTSATVGILVAVLGGLFLIKRSTEKGHTQFISSFKELPSELRSGLMHPNKRIGMGNETVSPSSIDPLVLHLSIIAFVVGVSYWVTGLLESILPGISVPLLSIAFVVALLFQVFIRKVKADEYVDQRVMERIGGSATDYLVAIGIASINITVVMDYAVPLLLLFVFGIIWAYLIFRLIGPNIFKSFWFEKSLFGWGWSTGTVAMGLALLRIVDPELKSKTMDDYALAYIGMVPIEIVIITFSPILFSIGFSWVMPITLLLVGVVIIAVHKRFGLWGPSVAGNASDKKIS